MCTRPTSTARSTCCNVLVVVWFLILCACLLGGNFSISSEQHPQPLHSLRSLRLRGVRAGLWGPCGLFASCHLLGLCTTRKRVVDHSDQAWLELAQGWMLRSRVDGGPWKIQCCRGSPGWGRWQRPRTARTRLIRKRACTCTASAARNTERSRGERRKRKARKRKSRKNEKGGGTRTRRTNTVVVTNEDGTTSGLRRQQAAVDPLTLKAVIPMPTLKRSAAVMVVGVVVWRPLTLMARGPCVLQHGGATVPRKDHSSLRPSKRCRHRLQCLGPLSIVKSTKSLAAHAPFSTTSCTSCTTCNPRKWSKKKSSFDRKQQRSEKDG
eukprot:m.158227 g.158227  ORF g.158227 m.158227 type:complete len:323 (-) comp17596_c0_seq2:356-1324(-)